VNISNPAQPTLVGRFDTPGYACSVFKERYYAFIADSSGGLRMVDVRDPSQPVEEGFYILPAPALGITVENGLAYVADGAEGLYIFDVSEWALPQPEIVVEPTGLDFGQARINERRARDILIRNTGDGVLSISNLITHTNAFAVEIDDGFDIAPLDSHFVEVIFITDRSGVFLDSLTIVSNDLDEQFIQVQLTGRAGLIGLEGIFDTPGSSYQLDIEGNILCLADLYGGLRIYNIQNRCQPHELSSIGFPNYVTTVDVVGNYAYVVTNMAGLRVVDISNPSQPCQVGLWGSGLDLRWVRVVGNVAYLTQYGFGLILVDITNPAQPNEIIRYNSHGEALVVDVADGIAYLANGVQGFLVLDVSDPYDIQELSHFNIHRALSVSVEGECAFLTDEGYSIEIFDISNPDNIRHLSSISPEYPPFAPFDAKLIGFHLFTSFQYGFWIYDISDLTQPARLARFDNINIRYLEVIGNFAYIAGVENGLYVFNISAILGDLPNIVVSPLSIDFGELVLGVQRGQQFIISNTGAAVLNVSSLTASGAPFSTAFIGAFNLAPDSSFSVDVTFAPQDTGTFIGALTIVSNDPDEDTVRVALQGVGVSQEVENRPPVARRPIPDIVVDEDFGPLIIADLDTVFYDADGDSLMFSVISSAEQIIPGIDESGFLTIDGTLNWNGEADITVRADDGRNGQDAGPVRSLREVNDRQGDISEPSSAVFTQQFPVRVILGGGSSSTNISQPVANPLRRDAIAQLAFTITVRPVNDPPVWTSVPQRVVTEVGEEIEFIISGEDIDGDYLTITANIPQGARFTDNHDGSGVFRWTPGINDAGEHTAQFTLSDGHISIQATVTFNIGGSPWEAPEPNDWPYVLNIGSVTVYPVFGRSGPLAARSWIGIFRPDSSCVGFVRWEGEPMQLFAAGDNPFTEDVVEGFLEGESIHLRVLDAASGIEYLARPNFLVEGQPRTFRTNYYASVSISAGATFVATVPTTNYTPVYNNRRETHSILVRSATINEQSLEIGDEVAVLTPNGLCVGASVWIGFMHLGWLQQPQIGIIARPDDDATQAIDGFRPGQNIRFYIWDHSSNTPLRAEATYVMGPEEFTLDGISVVDVRAEGRREQHCHLRGNWQMVSTNLVGLEEVDIPRIMANIVADRNLVIVKDQDGRFYLPVWGWNGIPQWYTEQAYQLKVNNTDTLVFSGTGRVNEQQPIPLRNGWSLVAYYPNDTLDAEVAFANIIGERQGMPGRDEGTGTLIIAKDDIGNFLLNLPQLGIFFNGLPPLAPTKGYQVKVDDQVDFIWNVAPCNDAATGSSRFIPSTLKFYHPPAGTGANMSLLVRGISNTARNCELGVFAGERCIGGVVLDNQGPWGTPLWGDDISTSDVIEGAKPEEPLVFRLWDGVAETAVQPEFIQGAPVYSIDGITIVSFGTVEIPLQFGILAAHPNPFNSSTAIQYHLDKEAHISLKIYAISGRRLQTLVDELRPAGRYTYHFSAQSLASGVYICKLSDGLRSDSHKIIIIK